jgi:hypothetical protein
MLNTIISMLNTIGLYLNNALMQSPAKISKTQKAIDYIKHYCNIVNMSMGSVENGVHPITIILTNNNLSETRQWKIRLQNKLDGFKTLILSSSKDSTLKNIGMLSNLLLKAKNASELPDLIVMCTHDKRIEDVLEIIDIFKNNNLDLTQLGIHAIIINIMIDEADKNMKLISSFLKDLWTRITDPELNKDNVLSNIHFITATPLKEFWKALKSCGILKLKNVNRAIQEMDDSHVLHTNYSDLMQNYRWLNDHERNHSVTDMSKKTVDYAEHVLKQLGHHDSSNPRIIFAPAENGKPSHYAMQYLFQEYGYWVYVDNSDKETGKRFYQPDGKSQSIDDFRKMHKVEGEPYEVFKKWKELHPTESLAITGWLTIIRGITFNTTDFNFTDMILSAGHMPNIADLLQVSGRANGDIQYVGCFTIHCPKDIWDLLDNRIKLMTELHEKNIEEFEEKDFRQKTKRDEQEVAWTIPYVFSIGKEKYEKIKKIGKSKIWDTETILSQIDDEKLIEDLRHRKKEGGQFQITQPEKDDTYKKYITDFIQKATENRIFNMGLHTDNKNKDGYQIFLDNRGFNIIVSIYNGTKI